MTDEELAPLLAGQSVYQDVVLAGRVARRGERDCEARWSLIEPHLPRSGAVLDVGSNFGWFALRTVATRADAVVVSAEADERSALVQRAVLQSHDARRVVLVTRRAGAKMAAQFMARRQRFAAVYCLSVLHWMRDHRAFLRTLANISARIFLEYPEPSETNVGIPQVRAEIGDFETYLREVFHNHNVSRLGSTPGLAGEQARSIWLVAADDASSSPCEPARVGVPTLLKLAPSWPNRRWWQAETSRLIAESESAPQPDDHNNAPADEVYFAPHGLTCANPHAARPEFLRIDEQIRRTIPEAGLFTPAERLRRRTRQFGGRLRSAYSALGRALSSSK